VKGYKFTVKNYKYKVSEDNIWENLYLTIVFSLN